MEITLPFTRKEDSQVVVDIFGWLQACYPGQYTRRYHRGQNIITFTVSDSIGTELILTWLN